MKMVFLYLEDWKSSSLFPKVLLSTYPIMGYYFHFNECHFFGHPFLSFDAYILGRVCLRTLFWGQCRETCICTSLVWHLCSSLSESLEWDSQSCLWSSRLVHRLLVVCCLSCPAFLCLFWALVALLKMGDLLLWVILWLEPSYWPWPWLAIPTKAQEFPCLELNMTVHNLLPRLPQILTLSWNIFILNI